MLRPGALTLGGLPTRGLTTRGVTPRGVTTKGLTSMVPANWGLTTGDLTYRGLTTRSLTSGGPTIRAPTSRGPTSKSCTTRGLTYRSFTVGGISSSRLDFLRSLRFSFPVTVVGPSASEGRAGPRSLVRFLPQKTWKSSHSRPRRILSSTIGKIYLWMSVVLNRTFVDSD